jgi:hypothetical protein
MTRRLSLVFGIVLSVGAFVGYLLLGAVTNPSPYPVWVVVTDVQPGEILTRGMVGSDPQRVSPRVAQEYVLGDQLEEYLGKYVARQLVPGQPLMHHDVVAEGNPAGARRLALVLEDPDDVAMVLPVEEENVVDLVLPGDSIAIVWSIGEGALLTGSPGAPEEQSPYSPSLADYTVGPEGQLIPVAEEAPRGEEEGEGEGELPPYDELPSEVADLLGASVTEEIVPEVSLPLAKTLVNVAQVIQVRREEQPNPAYTGDPEESPYIPGRIIGLDLVVPRDEMEAIRFAVANGDYSVVILSPNADLTLMEQAATYGVMWSDVKAYIAADRMKALGVFTATESVRPAGAADVYQAVLNPRLVEAVQVGEEPVAIPPRATPHPDEEETPEPGEEASASTPAPVAGPLPTATPAAAGVVEEPVATSAPEAPPVASGEGSTLPVASGSLLTGAGCVAAVVVVVLLAVFLVVRRLRSTEQAQTA